MRIRSIVDESLVHRHRGCEFEPRHPSLFLYLYFFSILYFYQFIYLFIHLFIYLFKDIIHSHFQSIWVAEYRFKDSKECIPY